MRNVIITAWVISLLITVLAISFMRYATGLPRLVAVTDIEAVDLYDMRGIKDGDLENFRRELSALVAKASTTEAKAMIILEWVMNQVSKSELSPRLSAWEAVKHARAGGGLSCGGMAEIYRVALLANSIPARKVVLQRNLFDDIDTHVTVEVLINGRWQVFDPTFHLAIMVNNIRVGIFKARESVIFGRGNEYMLEFLGEVRYPARIDKYPIRLRGLMNNSYVELHRDIWFLDNIPLVGSWLSRELAYRRDDPDLSEKHQVIYTILYYVVVSFLPMTSLFLSLILFIAWLVKKQKNRSASGLHVQN